MTKIVMPKCKWCQSTDFVYRCQSCHLYTCRECFRGMTTSERCVHEKTVTPLEDEWQSPLEKFCEENLLDYWQGYS